MEVWNCLKKKINMYYVPNGYKTLGKFMKKFNENDRKHIEAYSTLDKRLEKQTSLQEKQFESQERLENI